MGMEWGRVRRWEWDVCDEDDCVRTMLRGAAVGVCSSLCSSNIDTASTSSSSFSSATAPLLLLLLPLLCCGETVACLAARIASQSFFTFFSPGALSMDIRGADEAAGGTNRGSAAAAADCDCCCVSRCDDGDSCACCERGVDDCARCEADNSDGRNDWLGCE